jgi:hypothetical protein
VARVKYLIDLIEEREETNEEHDVGNVQAAAVARQKNKTALG